MAGVHVQELIVGAVVSLILSYILSSYVNFSLDVKSILKVIMFVVLYIPVLILELIKANLDVAKRVLNPKLPINPGIVKVPTRIKGDFGKLVLVNSITLTPGTISIDADEENVYIHWIDVKGATQEAYQKEISGSFEKVLGRIFND
jgi:multicomponent Na+:H+ antiporter subunit E